MLTVQPQAARHGVGVKQHTFRYGLRSHRIQGTDSVRLHVDARAVWAKGGVPAAHAWTRRGKSSPARLCQPPNATSNGASGALTVAISGSPKTLIYHSGGSGLIGARLAERLAAGGHSVVVLTRDAASAARKLSNPKVKFCQPAEWKSAIAGVDAVVNLAGEPIATRWSEQVKQQIMQSRVGTTRTLVDAINAIPEASRPKVLVSSSAVGFYGVSESATFDEESPPGGDFLSKVCQNWEAEASKAETRVVLIRTGIVMSTEGGALAKMLPMFEMFLGGPLGTGSQWMSWVHIDDLVGLIMEAVTNEKYSGVYNGTAPNPVRMTDLCASISAIMKKPSWIPVPAFALQGLLAEGAETVLNGQRVLPKKTQQAGYRFQHPRIQEALKSILS